MATLGTVTAVDATGVFVLLPGGKGVTRGPYDTLQNVAVGNKVLVVTTDEGDNVIVGLAAAASPRSGPSTSVDNTLPRFDGTAGALQTSGIVVDDNNRLRVASGSSGGLETGSSGILRMAGTGGPSGIAAPVGSTWRQTDANSTHGSLAGLLWNKVGTGTTEGTDWLVDFEGRWVDWAPTLTNISLGTGSAQRARYIRSGKTVTFEFALGLGTTGAAVSADPSITLPVAPASTSEKQWPLMVRTSDTYSLGTAYNYSGLTVTLFAWGSGSSLIGDIVSVTGLPGSWDMGNGRFHFTGTYEI